MVRSQFVERFRAIRLSMPPEGSANSDPYIVLGIDETDLPAAEVDVAVQFSAVSRLDIESIRRWRASSMASPTIPGCDFVGTVLYTTGDRFRAGDSVVATAAVTDPGAAGGWAERSRQPADRFVRLPDGLTSRQAISIGTPGLAAMMAVSSLEQAGLLPESGPVLVTGGTGALGTRTIVALSSLGYEVVATTRRPEQIPYLLELGATMGITPAEIANDAPADESPRWAAVIDCVGGVAWGPLVLGLRHRGIAICIGHLVEERSHIDLSLVRRRALQIIGLNAVCAGRSRRIEAWERWADLPGVSRLKVATSVVSLGGVSGVAEEIASGASRGRTVIDLTR